MPEIDSRSLELVEFDKVLQLLTNHAAFSAGAEMAVSLLPATDPLEIREMQLQTSQARMMLDSGRSVRFGGASDVRSRAERAAKGVTLLPDDLLDISRTITVARESFRTLAATQLDYPELFAVALLIPELPDLTSEIESAIDERGTIRDSATAVLARIRHDLQVADSRLQEKLRALIGSSMNRYLQEPIITRRSGRFVVPLKADFKGRIPGIVHDQSSSGATLWIEPLNTVDLNNEYRTLRLSERDEIERILATLTEKVGENAEAIFRAVRQLAQLDLIFAKARFAVATDSVEPLIEEWSRTNAAEEDGDSGHPGSKIWLRQARHPLLPGDTTVPIDVLVPDDTFLVLITGPNTGGKTVSLKTIALMAAMAQAGLQLPAAEARLTPFNGIFVDIGDEQSLEQSLSTFSAHIIRISSIIAQADRHSLVLLDELGSGTDPSEGAALAQAIASYLQSQSITTFIATHFPEMKLFASKTPGAINASLLFDLETLSPTYEMTIGIPGRSHALAISGRVGLKQEIIDYAANLVGSGSDEANELLDSIYELREQIAADEARARLLSSDNEKLNRRLERELAALQAEKTDAASTLQRAMQAKLREFEAELQRMRRSLRETASITQIKKSVKESRALAEELVEDQPVEPAPIRHRSKQEILVGDRVRAGSLGAKGIVTRIDAKRAEISVGRLQFKTVVDDLSFISREEAQEEEPAFARAPVASPGIELDIRGQRADEALTVLERHLDQAFLANLPFVRVIHGKGTGRLKEAVRRHLTQNGHVVRWVEGVQGEGGAGVTVAHLDTAS